MLCVFMNTSFYPDMCTSPLDVREDAPILMHIHIHIHMMMLGMGAHAQGEFNLCVYFSQSF
jgi:hypothetical protein